MIVPVHNDLIENQTYGGAIEKITNLERYVVTLEYFVKTFWTFGAWSLTPFIVLFAYVALKGIDRNVFRNSGWLAGCLILAIVLAGYFVVYINSPFELRSHLVTSLDRLMIHLWPSFLLLLGLCTRRPSLSGDHQAAVIPELGSS